MRSESGSEMTRRAQAKCAFCQYTGKLTREHLVPEWLKVDLPAQLPHHNHVVSRPSNGFGSAHVWKKGRLNRSGDTVNQRVHDVCQGCNSGWMSSIEESSKPIIRRLVHGDFSPMTKQERGQVAKWIALRTMVIELADPDTVCISREDRDNFRQTNTVPRHWLVGLAPYISEYGDNSGFFHRALGFKDASAPDDPELLQMTFFHLGSAVFHCASANASLMRALVPNSHAYERETGLDIVSPPSWFRSRKSPAALTADDVRRIADRFNSQNTPSGPRPHFIPPKVLEAWFRKNPHLRPPSG